MVTTAPFYCYCHRLLLLSPCIMLEHSSSFFSRQAIKKKMAKKSSEQLTLFLVCVFARTVVRSCVSAK
jgi:hypothetical protein